MATQRDTIDKLFHFTMLFFVFLIFCSLFSGHHAANADVACGSPSMEKSLMKCLMESYDYTVRPIADHSLPLKVNFSTLLVTITDMNEKTGVLTTDNWMRQVWVDEHLQWDPKDFGNLTEIRMPADRIWTPGIVLFNNAAESFEHVMDKLAIVTNGGLVTWVPHARLQSFCSLDMSMFPYDSQTCHQTFGSWTYDKTKVEVNLDSSPSAGFRFLNNRAGEWDVLGYSARPYFFNYGAAGSTSYPSVIYSITIKRNTLYYRYMLVYPTIILTILTLMIFWIPQESHQRLMLASGILVSITMLLLLLESYLPTDLGTVPIIASYLAFNLVFLTISIAVSLLTFNFYNHDPKDGAIPNWMRWIFLGWVSRLVCVKGQPYTPITLRFEPDDETQRELHERPSGNHEFTGGMSPLPRSPTMAIEQTMDEIRRYLRILAEKSDGASKEQMTPHSALVQSEWKQLAVVIDRLLFLFFVIIAIIITLAMYAHT